MSSSKSVLAALAVASLASGSAVGQHGAAGGPQPEEITLDAQGGDYPEWFQNPHMVEFYALSVEMLRAKRGRVDVAGYERRSYAIFGVLAASLGADPAAMIAHLNAIPREMVGIVAKDATALDSYESFLVALRGPR